MQAASLRDSIRVWGMVHAGPGFRGEGIKAVIADEQYRDENLRAGQAAAIAMDRDRPWNYAGEGQEAVHSLEHPVKPMVIHIDVLHGNAPLDEGAFVVHRILAAANHQVNVVFGQDFGVVRWVAVATRSLFGLRIILQGGGTVEDDQLRGYQHAYSPVELHLVHVEGAMVLARPSRRNPTQGLGSVKRSPAVLYAEGVGARAFGGEGQAKVSEGAEGGHHFVGDTVLMYDHEATDQEAALGNGLTIRPGAQDDVVLVALGARGGNDGAEPVQVVEAGGRQTGTWHGSKAVRADVEE